MQETDFDEAFELIRARDQRYPREAYLFVQEALTFTQKNAARTGRTRVRHVTGPELLEGIREYALAQFGPMSMAVLEEWQIRSCRDFGEIVFNMVEAPTAVAVGGDDFKDPPSFLAGLKQPDDPLAQWLWDHFSEPARQAAVEAGTADHVGNLLASELTRIIAEGPLYEPHRFARVSLSGHARSLLGGKFTGVQLARLNRLLLEEAYPLAISRGPGLLAKTEKDSRADFDGGYDFWDVFRKPYLPSQNDAGRPRETNSTRP